jgi:hypothetical protein
MHIQCTLYSWTTGSTVCRSLSIGGCTADEPKETFSLAAAELRDTNDKSLCGHFVHSADQLPVATGLA